MAKQDQSGSFGWFLRELWSLLKPYMIPLIVSGLTIVIMTTYTFFSELPLMAVIPLVLLSAALAGVGVAVCLKIVWAIQDRKSRKEYGKVVSFPGKRGKRQRWQGRVQQLMDSAPGSGDRKEAIRWRDEILEMFENFCGSQSAYARTLLERMVGLEKDADVSECVKKALDYLGDIKKSEF